MGCVDYLGSRIGIGCIYVSSLYEFMYDLYVSYIGVVNTSRNDSLSSDLVANN